MDISQSELVSGNDQPVIPVTPEAVNPWSKKMITLYMLANFGLAIVLDTPAVTSLSLRIAMVDPIEKATSLGLIIGTGSFAQVIHHPHPTKEKRMPIDPHKLRSPSNCAMSIIREMLCAWE